MREKKGSLRFRKKQHSKMDEFVNKNINSEERASRRDMCKLIKRSYQQQLFTSTQGTFSQRLSDGTFLIKKATCAMI